MSEKIAFYRCDAFVEPSMLPDEYSLELWRPGFMPDGGRKMDLVLWLFHLLRVFSNRDYSVVLVRHDGTVVHASYVFPRFFRFPFMVESDLQVGDTWTNEAHRGKGLATAALTFAASGIYDRKCRIWYLTDADNVASVKTAERAGFELIGFGRKSPRLGSLFLGYYEMVEVTD